MMLPDIGALSDRSRDCCLLIGRDTPMRPQPRLGSLQFRIRLRVIALRLLAILDGRAAGLLQAHLAVERLLGERDRGARLFDRPNRPARDRPKSITASSCPWVTRPPSWTLRSTTRPVTGGSTLTVRAGISLDERRQHQRMGDLFHRRLFDGEQRSQAASSAARRCGRRLARTALARSKGPAQTPGRIPRCSSKER